jgi:hypothetical protein
MKRIAAVVLEAVLDPGGVRERERAAALGVGALKAFLLTGRSTRRLVSTLLYEQETGRALRAKKGDALLPNENFSTKPAAEQERTVRLKCDSPFRQIRYWYPPPSARKENDRHTVNAENGDREARAVHARFASMPRPTSSVLPFFHWAGLAFGCRERPSGP